MSTDNNDYGGTKRKEKKKLFFKLFFTLDDLGQLSAKCLCFCRRQMQQSPVASFSVPCHLFSPRRLDSLKS